MTDYVNVGGLRVRVSVRGSGRPLLLFNGIGAALELFEPFRRALHSTETIAFDVPGSGSSETTTLPLRLPGFAQLSAELLDRLGYAEVDVLGVSWGGALAQEFTLRHARRVRRLVLAATGPGWIAFPGDFKALWTLATPRRYYSPTYLEQIAPTIYGGAVRKNPRFLREQGHLRFIHPPSARGYLYQLAAIWGWSSLFRLHRISRPTLVLAADDDPLIPLGNARLMLRRLRDARLHIISEGGHLFLITHADTLAPLIERFLAEETQSN